MRLPILYLAPMHGVTNRVYRNAFFRHFGGFDAAMAPFIPSANSSDMKATHFKDILADSGARVPVIPQVMSNDAAGFVMTARKVSALGYSEVNWNLGCPYPMIANKQRGAGLLPYPEKIDRFLEKVCSGVDMAISVKLRLGMYDQKEILDLMPILNGYPLLKLIIHARIGTQMYGGDVDLEGFQAALSLSAHPVVYNGDIKDTATFEALRLRFPLVNEWMIGRWALSNPFIASTIRGAALPDDPVGVIHQFHDDLYACYRRVLYGPRHVLDKMKEIWSYLAPSFSGSGTVLKSIGQARTLEAFERTACVVFEEGQWLS
jgi:tRNA-dihydrouridine synthase